MLTRIFPIPISPSFQTLGIDPGTTEELDSLLTDKFRDNCPPDIHQLEITNDLQGIETRKCGYFMKLTWALRLLQFIFSIIIIVAKGIHKMFSKPVLSTFYISTITFVKLSFIPTLLTIEFEKVIPHTSIQICKAPGYEPDVCMYARTDTKRNSIRRENQAASF